MTFEEIIEAIGIKPYYLDLEYGQAIYCSDCRLVLPKIPGKSIDLVLTDPPYGTTACSWDTIIPFNFMWNELLRISKDDTPIIFTSSQPFTSALVMSKPDLFRHEWIYQKRCASNFAQSGYAPMKEHENILVFGKQKVRFYPIKEMRKGSGENRVQYKFSEATRHKSGEFVGAMQGDYDDTADTLRFPSSVQEFNNRATGDRGLHPTQKPLKLFEYLLKTYSLEGDIILDFALGSGTSSLASLDTRRKCIGIEISEKYCEIAKNRLSQSVLRL